MLEFACRDCGKLVNAKSMDQIFEWGKVCKKCSKKPKPRDYNCKHCLKGFTSKQHERFCSPECRYAHKDEEK